MTDQLTALRELVAKVEAGEAPVTWRAFDADEHLLMLIHNSYNGSLDAAKALHEALLPNYSAEARLSGFGGAQAAVWNPMIAPSAGQDIRIDHPDHPARAWLIAILKAKIAKLEATQ